MKLLHKLNLMNYLRNKIRDEMNEEAKMMENVFVEEYEKINKERERLHNEERKLLENSKQELEKLSVKTIEELYLKNFIKDFEPTAEAEVEDIRKGYSSMWNQFTQLVLERRLTEHIKKMAEGDWRDKDKAAERYGRFAEIKYLKENSKFYHDLRKNEKPLVINKEE